MNNEEEQMMEEDLDETIEVTKNKIPSSYIIIMILFTIIGGIMTYFILK